MSPSRSRERTFEREGTLDKLSELHTITRHTAGRDESSEEFDQEELETAGQAQFDQKDSYTKLLRQS